MAKVPYRLWSDAPRPTSPARTVIVKLKPTTDVGRDAVLGVRRARRRRAALDDESEPPSELSRLLENARIKTWQNVFDREASPRGARKAVRRARIERRGPAAETGVWSARGLVSVEVDRNEDPAQLARYLTGIGAEIEDAYVPRPRRMFAKKKKKSKAVDPLLTRQWGHGAVRAAQARQLTGFEDASDIVVAVADSGIDENHPDLKGAIAEYKSFVKGERSRDLVGHGTHIAGVIAAQMNNGVGVAGLCAAKLLVLKVLPSEVEWDAAAYYRALAYCIRRARVLNISFGDEEADPGEKDVIADLLDAGSVVVAAMGNEFEHGNPVEFPAALNGVCAVGATDHADRRGRFSCTGKHIALSAPGVAIVSTTPTYEYPRGESDYDAFDGTSVAAPHVAAAAALLLAKDPALSPAEVIDKLQCSADRCLP